MRTLIRWLTPGMGIKRWLFLAVLGLLTVNGGVIALTYFFVRELRGRSTHGQLVTLGVVCVLMGMVVAAFAARRLIREVVRVLHPAPPRLLDAFYRQRSKRGPKLVAIGGGTGLSTLLRGLKAYSDNITAIVAMADNGGSSGRLREELGVLPPGDIRHCLTALAGEEELMTRLFDYRFRAGTTLLGHSFGNLFLTAMADITGDLEQAIRASSRVLAVRGQVLPATLVPLELVATLEDGSVVRGESQITESQGRIAAVRCEPEDPSALPEAIRAIQEADAIILGPGSLYTSIAPNLLIPGLTEALLSSQAPRLYICNVMTQPGETDDYKVSDHVRALQQLAGPDIVQFVLVNEDLPQRLLEKYQDKGQFTVEYDAEGCAALGVRVLMAPLLDEGDMVRHDPEALSKAIVDWLLRVRRESGAKILPFPVEAELSAKTKGWL
ncbi:MAG TPA: gluconeogenesis factor YvcK family protein [Stenomitos sp.]